MADLSVVEKENPAQGGHEKSRLAGGFGWGTCLVPQYHALKSCCVPYRGGSVSSSWTDMNAPSTVVFNPLRTSALSADLAIVFAVALVSAQQLIWIRAFLLPTNADSRKFSAAPPTC